MKNNSHITELSKKMMSNLEQLSASGASQIDIDICLDDIRKLYEAVRTVDFKNNIDEKDITTEHSVEKKEESEKIIEKPIQIEEKEEADAIEFIDSNEKTEEIKEIKITETAVINKEVVNTQEKAMSESTESPKTIKKEQADLFGNTNANSSKQTIGDQLGINKRSLNETFSKDKKDKDLASKLQNKPVTDIKTAIGIGDRFLFIRELFDGDNDNFNNTITLLNGLSNFDEAIDYIGTNFDWDKKEETTKQFISIVSRKYN